MVSVLDIESKVRGFKPRPDDSFVTAIKTSARLLLSDKIRRLYVASFCGM
jgi:hypothetical protein